MGGTEDLHAHTHTSAQTLPRVHTVNTRQRGHQLYKQLLQSLLQSTGILQTFSQKPLLKNLQFLLKYSKSLHFAIMQIVQCHKD